MADKYDLPMIFNAFLPRIVNEWPITLAGWDHMQDRIRIWQKQMEKRRETSSGNLADHRRTARETGYVDPVAAICFARRFPTAQSVLLPAFYLLSGIIREWDEQADTVSARQL